MLQKLFRDYLKQGDLSPQLELQAVSEKFTINMLDQTIMIESGRLYRTDRNIFTRSVVHD